LPRAELVGDDADFTDPYMDTERGLRPPRPATVHAPAATQRASAILMDVIGYSLEEVAVAVRNLMPIDRGLRLVNHAGLALTTQ
jgi:hypothetical protein